MLPGPDEREYPPQPPTISLLKEISPGELGRRIQIPTRELAAQRWREMLSLTQEDQNERGIVTGAHGNKLLTSAIFRAQTVGSSIELPHLPFGIQSLLPNVRNLAFIHTHFMAT